MISLKHFVIGAFIGFSGSSVALAKTPSKPAHMIAETQARQTALKAYHGAVKSSELEYEGGKWIYSYDIADSTGNGTIHEVQIDAVTGALVSQTIEDEKAQAAEKLEDKAERK